MTVLSLLIVAFSARYLTFDSTTYFEQQRDVYVDRQVVLGLHIGGAIAALLIGPVQLAGRFRRRFPRWHRRLGLVYVTGVGVGGSAGLALAPTAHGGIISTLGFTGLALAWLTTTTLAVLAIARRDVATHRRWMIRSFALTFAAVTLRLYLGISGALGLDFDTSYVVIAWLCWVPNLVLAVGMTRPAPRATVVV